MLDFFSRFGRGRHENSLSWDVFDQPSCEKSSIRSKLADHVGDNVVLSPGGAVLLTATRRIVDPPPPPPSLPIVERFSGQVQIQDSTKII